MKKFFYCVIYALLCIHGAIASSEEKIKSRDVLEVELKVLVDDLWDIPGLEGKMGELIENLEKYVSENTRSVYKEIDYLDTLIRKWEIELEKKVNETNRYWKVINDEEERSSLLYYVVRRDNVYLDIINDMINKFDVNNSSHKKRFIAIMDPVFLHVNKNNEKIIELGEKLCEKSKGDEIFRTLVKVWFPNILEHRLLNRGKPIKMIKSGVKLDDVLCKQYANKFEEQKEKINNFNRKWNLLMENIFQIENQDDLDGCAEKMNEMITKLAGIVTFSPPKEAKYTEELSILFFDKIFIELNEINSGVVEFRTDFKKENMYSEKLNKLNRKLDTKNLMNYWDTIVDLVNINTKRDGYYGNINSYLLSYSYMKYKDKTRENLRKKNAEEKNTANDFLLKREDFLLLNELGEKTINQTFKNWKAFHDSLQGDDEKRGFCNILRRNVQEIKILPGEVYLNYLLVYADSDICDFTNSLGEMIYNEIMPRNEDGFMYSFFQINYRQKRMIELKNKFLGKAENNKPYFNRINAVFSEGKMSWYINNSLCGNTIAHAGCPDFRVFMPRSGYADLYKKSHMTDNYEKQIDLLNQLIKTLDNIDIIAPEIRTQKDVDRCLKEVEMACLQLEEVLNLKAPTDEKTAKNNGMIFYNKIWMRCTGHFYYVFDEEDDKKYKRWGHLQFSDYLNSENKVINKWVHLDEKMKLETDKLYESLEKLYKIWCDSDSYLKEEAAIIRSKVANKEE